MEQETTGLKEINETLKAILESLNTNYINQTIKDLNRISQKLDKGMEGLQKEATDWMNTLTKRIETIEIKVGLNSIPETSNSINLEIITNVKYETPIGLQEFIRIFSIWNCDQIIFHQNYEHSILEIEPIYKNKEKQTK